MLCLLESSPRLQQGPPRFASVPPHARVALTEDGAPFCRIALDVRDDLRVDVRPLRPCVHHADADGLFQQPPLLQRADGLSDGGQLRLPRRFHGVQRGVREARPSSESLPNKTTIKSNRENFGGLVLGCINADFCVQILI